ncbi:hypothetical protein KAU09_01070 [Candidatus Parcubacteria bacterium]|nr:hypothetical protein [Candidatus Parcubacteria bacterium]
MFKKIVGYGVISLMAAMFLCEIAIAEQPNLDYVAVAQTVERGCKARNWSLYVMCGICRESATSATIYFVFKKNRQFVNAYVKTKHLSGRGWIITEFDIMNEHPEFVFKKIKRN